MEKVNEKNELRKFVNDFTQFMHEKGYSINKLPKSPDIIKAIFVKKEVENKKEFKEEQEEEIGFSGVWKCMSCGLVIESVVFPYFPNMPDKCFSLKCEYKRFEFLKWNLLK